MTIRQPSILFVLSCAPLLLAGCPTSDDNLGSAGRADAGPDAGPTDAFKPSDLSLTTCHESGQTYQVGETVTLSACTTCICQQDGTLGLCTGACPPDAAIKTDTPATCSNGGQTYQVGETVTLSACTTCVCQQDGTLGLCTGACPPDAAINTDTPMTCSNGGQTYQMGETVTLSACTTCVCQQDGTLGMCTGACPPDENPDAYSGPAALCISSGGRVATSLCCSATDDFPSSCAVGACGCAPAYSHSVSVCSCPSGTCFDPVKGCVGRLRVCTPGADQTCNDSPIISSIRGHCQADGSCVCIPGTVLLASGKCS